MDGINKVTLLGNVGGDPRSRTFDGGGEVANITLATTKKGYTKRDGTQVPERTEWHNITASGSLAGVVRQYVHKGDRLYVEGELRTREYEKDGIKRYVTEVWMTDLRLLSAPKEQPAVAGYSAPQQQQTQQQTQQQQWQQRPQAARQQAQPDPFASSAPEDALPF